MTELKLKPEGIHIEYKKAEKKLPKDFWSTYSSFSNTEGGIVVLGISEDEKGNYLITGVENPEKIKKELFNLLRDDLKVSVNLISDDSVILKNYDGKIVIEIRIPEAPMNKKPVYLNRDIRSTYKRVNDGDHKATMDELKYMLRNAENDLDSDILENYDMTDLNKNSIENYRRLLIGNNEESQYINMSVEDMLVDIGAMKRNRKNVKELEYRLTVGDCYFWEIQFYNRTFPSLSFRLF